MQKKKQKQITNFTSEPMRITKTNNTKKKKVQSITTKYTIYSIDSKRVTNSPELIHSRVTSELLAALSLPSEWLALRCRPALLLP